MSPENKFNLDLEVPSIQDSSVSLESLNERRKARQDLIKAMNQISGDSTELKPKASKENIAPEPHLIQDITGKKYKLPELPPFGTRKMNVLKTPSLRPVSSKEINLSTSNKIEILGRTLIVLGVSFVLAQRLGFVKTGEASNHVNGAEQKQILDSQPSKK